MSATSAVARPAVPRTAWALAALGLLIALALAALALGGARLMRPTPFNGMISFGRQDDVQGDTVPYVINPDGTHERALTSAAHEAAFWSPSGAQVGFIDGVINADGSGYVPFGESNLPLHVPCWDWSPDGRRCLAEGWDDTDASRSGIYLVAAADRSNPVRLTHHQDVPGRFSRDGTRVSFQRGAHLWVVNVDGTGERQLGSLVIPTDLTDMSWSADDRSILVQSVGGLYAVDVATGQSSPVRIAAEPSAELWGGVYSPDGARILFRRPYAGSADLFTMRVDGTDVVRLTNTPVDEREMFWGTRPLDH